jgi:hypothetical protein
MPLIEETLNCFGHYGYGSGWKGFEYCVGGLCSKAQSCLANSGITTPKRLISGAVVQNRMDGACDRQEGCSRYAGVSPVSLVSNPMNNGGECEPD